MLQGLAPLTGEGTHGGSVSPREGRIEYGVTAGSAWLRRNGVTQEQLASSATRCDGIAAAPPVAILIGPWTMSSGEIVAASFARMPHARVFGEHSAGTELHGPISPDSPAQWGDWPTSDDAAVRAAHAWLRAHGRAAP